MNVVPKLTTELANLGVTVVSNTEDWDSATLLVIGNANRRKASVKVPTGFMSEAEEKRAVAVALDDVKQQLSSQSGAWPEEAE